MKIKDLVNVIERSRQHSFLYHFTDESNLPSISEYGLLSKTAMRDAGWWPAITGRNELSHNLDTANGIDPYVSVCLTQDHPMLYVIRQNGRLPSPKLLTIKPEVLLIPGVKLAFDVAVARGVKILSIEEALSDVDFDVEVLWRYTDWKDPEVQQRLKRVKRFELLVPNGISRDLIAGLV